MLKSFLKIAAHSFSKGSSFRRKIITLFKDKNGIEIGGPSQIFHRIIPVYPNAKSIDGCNFSAKTIWEGDIQEGMNYMYFGEKVGYQYIKEASRLEGIPDNSYDFLLSSHCLEHCANAIKTIKEWQRVVKKNGILLLVLPDRRFTFDNKRNVTTFNHLLEDYNNDVDERDLTHLPEILRLHDLAMDIPAGNLEDFTERSKRNFENRCLHHHVFDFELLKQLLNYREIKILYTCFVEPYHQIIVGKKQ